jgi:crotonobetainyl-CoA:carnitine CoA-transferase CaiB-like acyl-CoA transferase
MAEGNGIGVDLSARGPLADVRVLDLTLARAGPSCVRQLADWGADVIRIEPPQSVSDNSSTQTNRHDSDFQNLHRNKRSIALDLKSDEGHRLMLEAVREADVLVENMRPPVKHRLRIDYETLRAVNPRLVYGSISGFGQDGPYAERGSVDQIAQGLGGLMSVTGQPGQVPMRVGVPISDLAAGLYLAIGILVALHERERTGEGQWVQTSLLESLIGMLDFQATRWTIDGSVAPQEGNHHPTMIPMGCFAAKDGFVNVAAPRGRLLRQFCETAGLEEILTDPRFESSESRSANRQELNRIIEERLRTRTVAEWVDELNAVGVPAGPVNNIAEAFADPQVEHLGMTRTVDHPSLGPLNIVRNPVTLSRHPDREYRPTPDLGQHTEELLAEWGHTPDTSEDAAAAPRPS